MSKVSMPNVAVMCGSNIPGRFAFDLDLCGDAYQNHTLKLTLNLQLNPTSPIAMTYADAPDAVKNLVWNTQKGEFETFKKNFKDIAVQTWHRKMCLIPPKAASHFDVGIPYIGTKYMPNIECHFDIQFVTGGNAHWQVEVKKYPTKTAFEEAKTGAREGAYVESNSVDPAEFKLANKIYYQSAIAHEVGHMLGQPHAGILANSQDCIRGIQTPDADLKTDPNYAYLANSINSLACYGNYTGKAIPGVTENIMGMGSQISEINGISWLNALREVLGVHAVPDKGWKTDPSAFVPPRKLS